MQRSSKEGESGIPDRRIQRPSSMKPNQEPTMNRYQAATPRARTAISLAAAAMTALTLGLSVLPAKEFRWNAGPSPEPPRAASTVASTAPGDGMPIVVYGVREGRQRCRRYGPRTSGRQ
jgi:hypothetical protein